MSLVKKPEMTEKNLAAHRANGAQSHGAVTAAGQARAARANWRHGFYSDAPEGALIALGEDPAEYRRLEKSLQNNLVEGLQGELVQRLVCTFSRMKRAERMQDGLAVKRVQRGLERESLEVAPRFLLNQDTYERLCAVGRMLNRPDSSPSSAEIEGLIDAFGATPPNDIQRLFPLLRLLAKAECKAARPASEKGDLEPNATQAEGRDPESARQQLQDALTEVM